MKTNRSVLAMAIVAVIALILVQSPASGQNTGGSALSFNGAGDFVMVANNPLLELTGGTLELWFRPDWAPGSLNYDPVLIANQLGQALTRYSLHVDRNLGGIMWANGSSVSRVPYAFTRGEWVHLALVANNSAAQVYINGLPLGATTNGFGTLIGLPLFLGSDGVDGLFAGQMDEVRIWNIARNQTEIRYNISRALAGTEPGLVGYWRMDEGVGTTAIDATMNGLDGAVNGATWTNSGVLLVNTSGSFGQALDLVANRHCYVQVPASPGLALSNQFTFEAWIKPRSAQCSTILSRGDGANLAATDFIFQVGTDGTNCGVMKLGLMVGGVWTTSASALPLNVWTHVAACWDGAASRFYINGILDRAAMAPSAAYQSAGPLLIGRQGGSGSNYFDGALDEVRVWKVARTAAQIQANINWMSQDSYPNLIGYWQFNELGGIRAYDTSSLGNYGTLVNRPVRVPSFWAPVVTLNGASPQSLECHTNFLDPGAAIKCLPVAVAAGPAHGLALKPDGTAAGWGWNYNGQINVPVTATSLVALAACQRHSLALRSDGSVVGWGDNTDGQITIPPGASSNVVAIAAGGGYNGGPDRNMGFSLALKVDGSVFGWGNDEAHETEIPFSATNIAAISASGYGAHCLALRADGVVLAWGYNSSGQTAVPASANGAVAIAAGGYFSLALKPDGTVVGWGENQYGQITVPLALRNVVAIAAGYDHSLALKSDGTVVAWGNYTTNNVNTPPLNATNVVAIAAGSGLSLALKADGTILAWGFQNPPWNPTSVPASVNIPSLTFARRGAVDPATPGPYRLSYTAANAAGGMSTDQRTVIVADTIAPIVALTGANPLNLDVGMPFVDPGAIASDGCAGDLTASIVRTGSVDPGVPGAYTLTYTVADPGGNTTTTNRIVLVRGRPSVLGFTAFFSGTNPVTGSQVVQFLADVNPNGLPTTTFAQYGLNTAYPGRTALVNLPASYNTSTYYATLDGLMPGVTYHFRVAATNTLGGTYGPDRTFTVPLLFIPGDLNGDGRVDSTEINQALSNYWSDVVGLTMTNPATLGNSLFQFAFTNVSGWDFSVLASTNLADWELLPVRAQPLWQFHDPAGTNQPQRFYRLQWP